MGGREVPGTVREVLPRALYRVELDTHQTVVAHPAARPERNFIRLLVGDRVLLRLSSGDLGRGRIVRKLGP